MQAQDPQNTGLGKDRRVGGLEVPGTSGNMLERVGRLAVLQKGALRCPVCCETRDAMHQSDVNGAWKTRRIPCYARTVPQ